MMFLMSRRLTDITFPVKAQGLSFSTTLHSPLQGQMTLPAILPTVKNSYLHQAEHQ